MYEGEKREKMYYSSYLVMVEAKFLKKKMQTAYLSRQLSRVHSYCSKEKDEFFSLKSFPFFKKRTENEQFVPSGIIFHVFTSTAAAQERQHSK